MSRPECDKSVFSDIYSQSREAREARIEGMMIVKCNILLDGSVKNCRVIKPLPHLSEAVLAAMARMTCKPATFQGQPIAIDYVQNFQFKLPR